MVAIYVGSGGDQRAQTRPGPTSSWFWHFVHIALLKRWNELLVSVVVPADNAIPF